MIRSALFGSVAVASLVAIVGPVEAQHHHSGHGHIGGIHGGSHYSHGGNLGHHLGGHMGVSHYGHQYHSGWNHVVPSAHHHHSGLHLGSYYSYGGANYYTPVALATQVQVLRPALSDIPANALPSLSIEPIAPQSQKLEFGGFKQTEDLAGRLAFELNRWCLDMHYNYQDNAEFAETYRQAYALLQAAKYVHSAEHQKDREGIKKELSTLELRFHQVQQAISSWSGKPGHRQVGDGDLATKTAAVEAILHHLLYDVGIKVDHSETEEQAPPPAESIPPPALVR